MQYGLLSPYFALSAQYGLWAPYRRWRYGLLSPYFALWAQYGLWAPYFACAQYGLWAPYRRWRYGLLGALFRLRSIRALVALSPLAIRALGHPGLRCAYPGLYSGATSGRSISHRPIAHICHRQMSTLHRPIAHICHRQIEVYPVSRTLLGLGVRYNLGQFSLSDYDSIGPSSMLSIYPFEYLALSCKG